MMRAYTLFRYIDSTNEHLRAIQVQHFLGSLVRHAIPLGTLITPLNLKTLPIYPIHRSYIQRLYAPLLFHILLLRLGQSVHDRLWRTHRD